MKTRNVLGHAIVRVRQYRLKSPVRPAYQHVEYLELDNGIQLVPLVGEVDEGYAVQILVRKPQSKRGPP